MHPDDFVGKTIHEFEVLERIGRGGMASVYRAHQPNINRDVALKVIRLAHDPDEDDFPKRFAHEAKLIASLEHIHILPIYEYGIQGDNAYIAMRLLRGGTLTDLLRQGPLSLNRAADLFTQIARGLAYAHSKGIIHRDMKPSNILLDDSGNAYLTDFGLAKIIEGETDITKSGTVVGTPAYMSPEQLRGERIDHRSDIYSLGIVFYQMVAGKPPFETGSSGEIVSLIYKHLEEVPKPPSEHNPDIPAGIEEIILRALSKKPEDRFQSVEEMLQALNIALGRLSTIEQTTARKIQSVQRRREQMQRQNALRIAAGVVVAILVILGIVAVISVNNNMQAQIAAQTAVAQAAADQAMTQTAESINQTATVSAYTPTPLPRAIVLEGEQGTTQENIPSDAEIAAAQARLGDDGFIAYIACTQSTAYHAGQVREVSTFMDEYGLPVRVYDPNADSYQQVTLLDQAITDGASALLVCPLDAALLEDGLMTVEQAGIPLVLFTGTPPSYGGVLLAGNDYVTGVRAGRFAGQVINIEGGEANVIILDYPDLPYIVTRANGLEDGLLSNLPEANIIGRYLGGTREFGYESVRQLLEDGVEFNVILSINDAGAFGAVQALEEAGIDPSDVFISSIDAEPQAQQYIRDGYYFRASVAVNRTEFSRAAVYALIKLLAGSTIPETLLVEPGDIITREVLENADANPTATTPPREEGVGSG
jgi:ABC-type sugar transport system substrate-binding protein